MTKFENVHEAVHHLEDLRINPGPSHQCVPLNKMKFTSAGAVQVPGFGLLRMTDWARRQLGNEIGVRWDKFFGEQDADKINWSIQNHLKARGDTPVKKVIARRHVRSETASDGLLRGLVSPTYSEIRDARMLNRVCQVIGTKSLKKLGFSEWDARDNGSHFKLVHRDPIDLTGRGLAPNDFRGTLPGHTKPEKDIGYYGLRIRNSEVGAYSYTVDAYIIRLVCINGLMVAVDGERIMKRKHVGLDDDEKLDELIDTTFRAMPKIREKIVACNSKLRNLAIDNPQEELRNFLARHKQPKVIQEAAVKAFDDEPTNTALGIMNAITRLGMALREVPDRQHEIELLAGAYIDQTVAA